MGSTSNALAPENRARKLTLEDRELETRPTRLRPSPHSELLFRPQFEVRGPQSLELVAERDDENTVPWGLWGGLLAVVAGIVLIVYEGAYGFHSFWTIAIAVAVIGLGAIVARFGARSSLTQISLGRVDLQSGVYWIESEELQPIRLDSVGEVVYAMIKYPVSRERKAVKVQAFTVLLRVEDELIPVVEASPDKAQAFAIARTFAQWTGNDVSHVGIGVK